MNISTIVFFFGALGGMLSSCAQTPDNKTTSPEKEACKVLLGKDGTEYAYPRLSKDKKTILYQSNETGKWQLSILDIAAGSRKAITRDTFNNNFPDWSADNRLVAFVSDRDGNEEIYLVHADGSNLQRITSDAGRDIHPYFSPDGKYILFNSTRGNESLDIYRYTIETGKVERLTQTNDDETCARYSPDMTRIVYLRNGPTMDDVFELDMSNFLGENITKTPTVPDGWPMYGNNGKWIYYSSMESGTYCIYRVKTAGGSKQQLTTALFGEEDARVYISADGKTMIYNKRKGNGIDIRSCEIVSPR
ncbi:MAG: TolB protein [Bacteroidetes bacterium]|nr:MAG: TolB protein [Bacteroidota bacterium]